MSAQPRAYAVFAETLGIPVEGISDATAPENTPEWDSIKAMDLVVALEEAFDVRLSTKEIISMRTVGIVRKVLTAKGIQDA